MIEVDESILDQIIEAKKNNKLAFFIGAGFSKNAETEYKKIPLWSDLIADFKNSLEAERENRFSKNCTIILLKIWRISILWEIKKIF